MENQEDRERVEKNFQDIEERMLKLGKKVTLGEIISLMRKNISKSKRIHYIRIDTGTFFNNEKRLLPVPNVRKLPTFTTKRLVQVCFPCFPCQEIGLTDYRKYEDRIDPVFG